MCTVNFYTDQFMLNKSDTQMTEVINKERVFKNKVVKDKNGTVGCFHEQMSSYLK